MTEANVSTKLRVELSKGGAKVWKVSDRFHASRPDLVMCYQGRYIAIETKITPNKPTKAQLQELYEIVAAEGEAYVCSYHKGTKRYSLLHVNHGHTICFVDYKGLCEWLLRPLS